MDYYGESPRDNFKVYVFDLEDRRAGWILFHFSLYVRSRGRVEVPPKVILPPEGFNMTSSALARQKYVPGHDVPRAALLQPLQTRGIDPRDDYPVIRKKIICQI